MEKLRATAILLAGGKSSRFGQDKMQILVSGEQMPVRIAEKCLTCFDEVLLVSNTKDRFQIPGVRELMDIYPGGGPMGGLHAGLTASRNAIAFVTACDLPAFSLPLARLLVSRFGPQDILLAEAKGRAQPLFGIYRKSLLAKVEALLLAGKYGMLRLAEQVDLALLTEQEWRQHLPQERDPFCNVNQPEDLAAYLAEEKLE